MGMFDKFTERAQKVLLFAQEEALRLKHNYIGTEHILLGLIREGQGVAAQIIKGKGIELENIRQMVASAVGIGKEDVNQVLGYTQGLNI